MNEPGQTASPSSRRQLVLALVAVAVLALCAAAIAFVQLAKPVGVVRGSALGPVGAVLLSDAMRGILVEGSLNSDGQYEVLLPAAAREPMIQLRAKEGRSFVESNVLTPGGVVEVRPLALWSTPLRIRSAEGKVRLDWSPVPKGNGYPGRRRYSILIRFTKVDGATAEASLLSEEPWQEIPLAELKQLMVDRNPNKPQVEIELRAFDPREQQGPLWVGEVRAWDLPED